MTTLGGNSKNLEKENIFCFLEFEVDEWKAFYSGSWLELSLDSLLIISRKGILLTYFDIWEGHTLFHKLFQNIQDLNPDPILEESQEHFECFWIQTSTNKI